MGYPTDLTDAQWTAIEPRFQEINGNYGKNAKWNKRLLTDAVLYVTKTGCQWHMMPNDFPPSSTVWSFFRRARIAGLWEVIMDDLVKLSRGTAERTETPSYVLIDSQSVKTTGAAEERGIDGGKNEGKKASYSNRYHGKPSQSGSSRSKYTRYKSRRSGD